MSNPIPIHYKIRIEPDLGTFTFLGRTEILIEACEPLTELNLDMQELAIWKCRGGNKKDQVDCPFCVDPKGEALKVILPEETSGQITLEIDYMGRINDTMGGFYRSKFLSSGGSAYIAVTQFEESDARRAFPCFDHPRYKATFDVEIILPAHLVAISNAPILEEKPVDEGRKLVRFMRTPKMSTYLVFFGVGEFEFLEDPKDVLIRVATVPGMRQNGKFGLDFGRKSLDYCQEYYGIPYPLAKLDLIAIPDFAFGAMENWGAITFRENLLLQYPNMTSKSGEESICVVIAHEMAHQWFGNLVTPSDWKYLWLNESFATYFGYGVVDHYHPEWNVWDQFLHEQTDRAMDRDGFRETFPIEIPGGEHVIINASTAPIIYSKGGSVLRQIEGYIGLDCFREGLRKYLNEHAYGCASSHHLWEALEAASDKPVTRMMENWIGQAGFPIVEAKRDGESLTVTQSRFTYLPNDSDQAWFIPLGIRLFLSNGTSRVLTTLLETKTASVHLGPDVVSYKVNDGHKGFYRVRYVQKEDLKRLEEAIFQKRLHPEDRWGLQNDLFAMVNSGEADLGEYLEFLRCYENEDAFLPLVSIKDNLYQAFLVAEERRPEVAAFGKEFLERVVSEIGPEPCASEEHTVSLLRDQILLHAVRYGSTEIEKLALNRFTSLLQGGSVHPDIMKSVMQVGALKGDDQALGWFGRRLESSENEHERMNILVALGGFADPDLLRKCRDLVLEKVPIRNKFVSIVSMSANPEAMPSMWDWYLCKLDRLEALHPVHYERVIAAIVPLGGLGREKDVRGFFDEYLKRKDKGKDVIRLALEKLEVNSRMRKSSARADSE